MALRQLEEIQRGSGIETEEDVEHLHQMQMNLDPKRLMENLCRDLREEEGDDAAIAP